MANDREFIAAKDLPVTEAEEVDVLCVENGELKRKASASSTFGSVLLLENAYYNDSSNSGTVIFVDADLYARCNAEFEGKAPCFITVAGSNDGDGTSSQIIGGKCREEYSGVTFYTLYGWDSNFTLVASSVEADVLISFIPIQAAQSE